jgi:cellulose synthase/poly-beta-1,6-N-acetylglucosamine synthase-like glycosyltransferase
MLVRIAARLFGRDPLKADGEPTVTVIIAAYNEQAGIALKLKSLLTLDYPAGRLDIIVASDGSTDGTDKIVESYCEAGVTLLRVEGRQGKTACQNAAVAIAQGDILVFTDATTRLDDGALKALVQPFADDSVGCVAGSLVYEQGGSSLTASGGVVYWSYELSLRAAESRLSSLVGVSGCLYAVRRTVYQPIDARLISDFVIALRVWAQGLRTVLEPAAICFEQTHDHAASELAMRVRVAIRSINALVSERRMLNPVRYGAFAWQLWSHKLLRYASPFFWLAAFVSNLWLANNWLYFALLVGQLALIIAGLAGLALHDRGFRLPLLNKPYYFLLTNVASFIAAARFIAGERMVTWKPVR